MIEKNIVRHVRHSVSSKRPSMAEAELSQVAAVCCGQLIVLEGLLQVRLFQLLPQVAR